MFTSRQANRMSCRQKKKHWFDLQSAYTININNKTECTVKSLQFPTKVAITQKTECLIRIIESLYFVIEVSGFCLSLFIYNTK